MRRVSRITVSLLLLGLALWFLDWGELKVALLRISPAMFCLAILVAWLQFVVMGLRWHELVRRIAPLSLWEHMRHFFRATFLNTLTPANLGGDLYRFLSIKAHATGSVDLLVVLLRERIVGLLGSALFALSCLAVLFLSRPPEVEHAQGLFGLAAAVLSVVAVGILLLPALLGPAGRVGFVRSRSWLSSPLEKLQDATRYSSLGEFALITGLSLLAFLIWAATVWLVARNLDIGISWPALGTIVILVELARLVPISAQGIGVREGAYAYLFSLLGHSSESGFALGTLSYLALSCALLLSGGVGWLMKSTAETKAGNPSSPPSQPPEEQDDQGTSEPPTNPTVGA